MFYRVDDVDLSAESPPPVKKAKRRRKEPKDSEKSQLNEKNRRRDKVHRMYTPMRGFVLNILSSLF